MNRQVTITGLLIICLSIVSFQEKTYYVIPNDLPNKTECPGETCKSLTELLDDQNVTNNFSTQSYICYQVYIKSVLKQGKYFPLDLCQISQ